MMREYNEFDAKAQAKLQELSPTPPDWVAVNVMEALRKPKSDKKPFWLLLMAVGLVGGVLAGVYYTQTKETNVPVALSPATATQTEMMSATERSNSPSEVSMSQSELSKNSRISSTSSATEAEAMSAQSEVSRQQNLASSEQNLASSTKPRSNHHNLSQSESFDTQRGKTISNLNQGKNNQYSAHSGQNQGIGEVKLNQELNTQLSAQPLVIGKSETNTALSNSPALPTNQVLLSEKLAPKTSQSIFQLPLSEAALLATKWAKCNSQVEKQNRRPLILPEEDRIKRYADRGKYQNLLFLEAFAGPRYSHSMLKSTAIEFNDHLAQRKSTEHTALAYELGLRTTYVFNQIWAVQAGLQFAQQTEVFKYDDLEGVSQSSASFGSTIDTFDLTGIWRYEIYNRFHSLDIPLSIGVELRKGRSGFRAMVGSEINLAFKPAGGKFLDQSGQITSYTRATANQYYRSQVIGRLHAHMQFFRSFRQTDRLFIEPYLNYQPFSSMAKSAPLEQRYLHGGLRFGYALLLNK
jgi:hypothetical protein